MRSNMKNSNEQYKYYVLYERNTGDSIEKNIEDINEKKKNQQNMNETSVPNDESEKKKPNQSKARE